MSLQVSVKLKLTRNNNTITVKYNTFEKATYDQYLAASIALRAKAYGDYDNLEAETYIDAITGQGSLNPHFKALYFKIKRFPEEQLKAVMANSMFPTLKIDSSNKYTYYPELNISVFRGTVYDGDFGERQDLGEKLHIAEEIIEKTIKPIVQESPEPYNVVFDGKTIKVTIVGRQVELGRRQFEDMLVIEQSGVENYEGIIHDGADGNGWHVLAGSVIETLLDNKNYYYDREGDYYQIRVEDVKKTTVAKIGGLYIYKEEQIPYKQKELCTKVIEVMFANSYINEFKTKALLQILEAVDGALAQKAVNHILKQKNSKELALLGVNLLSRGVEKGWTAEALSRFMEYADSRKYTAIYRANPTIDYGIEILTQVEGVALSSAHKELVDKYRKDRAAKIADINKRIGQIVTSGILERVKQLKATEDTKRLTALRNKYVGHEKSDIGRVSDAELDKRLNDVTEMENLIKKVFADKK